MPRISNYPPVLLAGLREVTSKRGGTHLAGHLGTAHILIVPNRNRQGSSEPTHLLMVVAPGEPEGAR